LPTKPETATTTPPLVEVTDLRVHFALRGGFFSRLIGTSGGSVKAVDGVSFSLGRGEVLGLVGESGSGKTTLGRALVHLAPVTGGSVRIDGKDVTELSERAFRPNRRTAQVIFQDPNAALNPAMDIGTAVRHPLVVHGLATDRAAADERVRQVLERVGLTPVDRYLTKYPADLSGGQKQRAVIARAIILGPKLLVADEPVSMLDMSVRSKILELMMSLKDDLDLTYLYITHDLATAKFFCDRIAIMYLGRIVEIGPAAQIYADPKHPYTQSLLRAIPEPDPSRSVPRDLPRGEVPDAIAPPLGCSFHPRCPVAFDRCGWESRDLVALLERRWTAQGEQVYDAERPIVGDIDALRAIGQRARLAAGSGHDGNDVLGLLERMRDEAPEEVFWSGVEDLDADSTGVTLRFRDGVDPVLTDADAARVACLRYPGADGVAV